MPHTSCGFNDTPAASGAMLLMANGPSLLVDIGFDPSYKGPPAPAPVPGVKALWALVDTGATECCIDAELAKQLNLPIIDKRAISGSAGAHMVDVVLAQIHVPTLNFTVYGPFCALNLAAGGQTHQALIGRTFLQNFTMTYSGKIGSVDIFN